MEKELNLDEIHEESLMLLKKFHSICDFLGIKYYLAYGTLLGAVRHKGFIPWDDDVDVWMSRYDIGILKEYLEKNCEDHDLKLCDRLNTKNYQFGVPRFSNLKFQYIDTSGINKYELGLFIDVYPLDNYSYDLNTATKLMKKIRKYNKLYSFYLNPIGSNVPKIIMKRTISFFLHLIHGDKYASYVENKIEKLLNEYTRESDPYVGIPTWTFAKVPQRFLKENFSSRILMDFEGEKFFCPIGYKEILETCYGDYMEFPPEDKRLPYHNYKIIKKVNL